MTILIDKFKRINSSLISLIKLRGFLINENILLEDLNLFLNRHWNQKCKFRYQIKGKVLDMEELRLLRKLGCIEQIFSPIDYGKYYDGVLVLGGTVKAVQKRLNHLINEYRRGVKFKQIFLLGSERPLNINKEILNILWIKEKLFRFRNFPKTEIEIMQYLVGLLNLSSKWEIIPILCPNITINGISRFANSGDSIIYWQRQTGYIKGNFLIISNQPFIKYQEINAKNLLSSEIKIFGIGQDADLNFPTELFLDNLAKQFYEEMCYITLKKQKEDL